MGFGRLVVADKKKRGLWGGRVKAHTQAHSLEDFDAGEALRDLVEHGTYSAQHQEILMRILNDEWDYLVLGVNKPMMYRRLIGVLKGRIKQLMRQE